MQDEWISIKEAAKQLGVSEKTIRRRIHKGELRSKIVDSPYGDMYMVEKSSIKTAQQVIEVVKVNKQYEVQDLAIALSHFMDQRDVKLKESLDSLKNEINELKKENAQIKDILLEQQEKHLKAINTQLENFKEEIQPKKRGFWSLFSK